MYRVYYQKTFHDYSKDSRYGTHLLQESEFLESETVDDLRMQMVDLMSRFAKEQSESLLNQVRRGGLSLPWLESKCESNYFDGCEYEEIEFNTPILFYADYIYDADHSYNFDYYLSVETKKRISEYKDYDAKKKLEQDLKIIEKERQLFAELKIKYGEQNV